MTTLLAPLLFLLLNSGSAEAKIWYQIKYRVNDSAHELDVGHRKHFELVAGKDMKCGGLHEEDDRLMITCKFLPALNSGSATVFHCPPGSINRPLGGASVFNGSEMRKIQVFCSS